MFIEWKDILGGLNWVGIVGKIAVGLLGFGVTAAAIVVFVVIGATNPSIGEDQDEEEQA